MWGRWTLPGRGLDGDATFVHRSELDKPTTVKANSPAEALAFLTAALGARLDRSGAHQTVVRQMLIACGLAPVDLARISAPELLTSLRGFVERGVVVMLGIAPQPSPGGGGGTDPKPPVPEPKPAPKPKPEPKTKKKVVSIEWAVAEAWCSEDTTAHGKTENYANDETIEVKLQEQGGSQTQSVSAKVSGEAFTAHWIIKNILPVTKGAHLAPDLKMDALAGGQKSPKPLTIKFVTQFAKVPHVAGRTHFELSLTDAVLLIESDIKYVQGWGGEVVKLGNKAPAGTGGLLDGQLTWNGYRWMKSAGLGKKFWDGAAWQSLPAGFVLADSNNFAVGFYKQGTSFTCQYGGTWPENFTDWNVDAPDKQSTITGWTNNIKTTWTGKFDFKRKDCKSSDKKCCRHTTKAAVTFSKQANFATGMLIIADGNIRSNDSLLFLGETRIAVAAHEFGHHLGNPDEYAGAAIDTTLNGDGAVNGIDADSIMGQNLTKVKVRHFREIGKAFTDAVKTAYGKTYEFLVVPP
jgi:hypothetical protein